MISLGARSLVALFALCLGAYAQQAEGLAVIQPKVTTYDYEAIPHDPLASLIFSATLPGAGQLYNKDYWRALAVFGGFWIGVLTTNYLVGQWDILNTDTFYVQEHYSSGTPVPNSYRMVMAPKSDKDMIGLPAGEKVGLIAALTVAAVSYAWGVVDAYQGANRYNARIFKESTKIGFNAGYDPSRSSVQVGMRYSF